MVFSIVRELRIDSKPLGLIFTRRDTSVAVTLGHVFTITISVVKQQIVIMVKTHLFTTKCDSVPYGKN